MDGVTQGRMLSRTQVWAQSHSSKRGEESISSENLWQIPLNHLPQPHMGLNFGVKITIRQRDQCPPDCPIPDFAQQHLPTSSELP